MLVSTVVFCALLDRAASCASAASRTPSRRAREAVARAEGPRRLRDLAARRRRARPATRPRWPRSCSARGHEVEVVTTADARARAASRYPVHWVSRSLPPGVRHAHGRARSSRRARAARRRRLHDRHVRPLVARRARSRGRRSCVKLTADPAFERARRRGLVARRRSRSSRPAAAAPQARLLRLARDADAPPRRARRHARRRTCASSRSAGACRPDRVTRAAEPGAAAAASCAPRDELRAELRLRRRRRSPSPAG